MGKIAIYNIYPFCEKKQNCLDFMKFCNGQRKIASNIKLFMTLEKKNHHQKLFFPTKSKAGFAMILYIFWGGVFFKLSFCIYHFCFAKFAIQQRILSHQT